MMKQRIAMTNNNTNGSLDDGGAAGIRTENGEIVEGESLLWTSEELSTVISGLTMEEPSSSVLQSNSSLHQQSGNSGGRNRRLSSNNSILPRSSFQARLSSRTKELGLSQLKFHDLPLFGRDEQLQTLSNAFRRVLPQRKAATNSTATGAKVNASNKEFDGGTTFSHRGLVLVSGVSGSGKTSLIQHSSIQKLVRKHGGMYSFGKCELQQVDEPYASVQDAMSLLCYKIQQLPRRRPTESASSATASTGGSSTYSGGSSSGTESKKMTKVTLEDVQDEIRHRIEDREWKFLIQSVPGLEMIMIDEGETNHGQIQGKEDMNHPTILHEEAPKKEMDIKSTTSTMSVPTAGISMNGSAFKETSDRLKFVYRQFISVISSVCPLVLVLDDVQWADKYSLEWIKSLLTDTSSSSTTSESLTNKYDLDATNADDDEVDSKGGERTARGNEDNGNISRIDTPSSEGNGGQLQVNRGSLLIVASYRSNEVDEDHELSKMIHKLRDSPGIVDEKVIEPKEECPSGDKTNNELPPAAASSSSSPRQFLLEDIPVGDLSVEDINSMLVELLSVSEPNKTMELAQVLHQKTMGNAFFLGQFLLRLKDDDQLTYNLGLMKWTWDVTAIQANYTSTENVADLMKEKLEQHPIAIRVLPIAACLGNTFSPAMLQGIIAGLHPTNTVTEDSSVIRTEEASPTVTTSSHRGHVGNIDMDLSIEQCATEGFIEAETGGNYRFVHDKIQEAALAYLDEDVKIAIGDIFLEQFRKDKTYFDDTIFSVVNLVNFQVGKLLNNDTKQLIMADLNATAGKKALDCAAFEPASRYLTIAMTLLPDDRWIKHKDLSLRVYTLAGAAEFCSGNRDKVKSYIDTVNQTNVPLLEKIDLCITMMDAYEVGLNSSANFAFGLELLKEFDCHFPKSGFGIAASTIKNLLKAKLQLKKKLHAEKLDALPIVTDHPTMALMKSLDKLSSAAFHAKPDLLPLIIFKMAKYTDDFGLNPYAAISYPVVGLLFAGVLDDFEVAKVCGNAGLSIMKRCNYPVINARCIMLAYVYALHWSTPIKNCMRALFEGYEIGMKMGTLDSAFWCIHFFLEFSFWTGQRLTLLHADYSTYINQMLDYDAQKAHIVMLLTRHMIARLLAHAEESDEDNYENIVRENGEDTLECVLRRTQMYVACILGEHEKTAQLSLEWQPKLMKHLPAQVNGLEVTFVSALSCMAVSRQNPKSKKYFKHAKACMSKIKSWVSNSCPNCVAHAALLEAEWLALKKDRGRALQNYESAVLLAGRRGLIHVQALCAERFAIYLEETGDKQESEYRYKEAITLYEEWGATAKVLQLRKKLGIVRIMSPSSVVGQHYTGLVESVS